MSWLEKLRLIQIWFCGDRELRELLNVALTDLDEARLVVAAAETYLSAPDSGDHREQLASLAVEVLRYRARHPVADA